MIETFLTAQPAAVRLVLSLGLIVLGLVALYYGSEYLVRGAIRLATRIGVGAFTIGVTVVAFGTSAPELFASFGAVYNGWPELAIGNVVGSNIANICLILGLSALIRPVQVDKGVMNREFVIMILITLVAGLMMTGSLSPATGVVTHWEGWLLFAALIGFVVWQYISGRSRHDDEAAARELEQEHGISLSERPSLVLQLVLITVGLGLLVIGAQLLVDGGVEVAKLAGVPAEVIGLTVLAFGTSVPELAAAIRATLAKEAAIVVGNIVGSNVFNLLCVLGLTAALAPVALAVPEGSVVRDIPVMLGVSVLAFVLMRPRLRLGRVGGGILLAVYLAYVVLVYV